MLPFLGEYKTVVIIVGSIGQLQLGLMRFVLAE
jgi:hypothetical protein